MAHKYKIGEEVWFRWGIVLKGKITAYTEELINDERISTYYKIKRIGQIYTVGEDLIYRNELEVANALLESYGVSEELRFHPICDKCWRVKTQHVKDY